MDEHVAIQIDDKRKVIVELPENTFLSFEDKAHLNRQVQTWLDGDSDVLIVPHGYYVRQL